MAAAKRTSEWRAKNPERHKEAVRRWAIENPERSKALHKKWIDANRDRARELGRLSYYRNLKNAREQRRRWRQENRAKVCAIAQRRRARIATAEGEFTADEFASLCEAHAYCCAYCFRRFDELTADHIVPLSRGGSNAISNIAPACGKCNSRKGSRTADEFYDYLGAFAA